MGTGDTAVNKTDKKSCPDAASVVENIDTEQRSPKSVVTVTNAAQSNETHGARKSLVFQEEIVGHYFKYCG